MAASGRTHNAFVRASSSCRAETTALKTMPAHEGWLIVWCIDC